MKAPAASTAIATFAAGLSQLPRKNVVEFVVASAIYKLDGNAINIDHNRVWLVGYKAPESYRAGRATEGFNRRFDGDPREGW